MKQLIYALYLLITIVFITRDTREVERDMVKRVWEAKKKNLELVNQKNVYQYKSDTNIKKTDIDSLKSNKE